MHDYNTSIVNLNLDKNQIRGEEAGFLNGGGRVISWIINIREGPGVWLSHVDGHISL